MQPVQYLACQEWRVASDGEERCDVRGHMISAESAPETAERIGGSEGGAIANTLQPFL